MLYAGRLQSGRFQWGAGDELSAIAAVILGGTSLFGGAGSVVGTLFGALLIGLINNGLILAGARVYYAMARDGLFFASVGKLFGRSEAPVIAIILQGFAAIAIACSGTYGEILNFEVTVDFIFFGMTATALFILRRHRIGSDTVTYRVPGHPFTTMLFVMSCAAIVLSAIVASPRNSGIALCIMLAGLPVYYFWKRSGHANATPG